MQRPGAGRGDVEVRREPAIRIDFVRRERQHGSLDLGVRQPFERREEEPGVDGQLLDVGVGRHDEQRRDCASAATAANIAFAGGVRPETSRRRRTKPKRPAAVFRSAEA